MLKLTNITKTFNPGTITEKKALRGIDLELDDGDFVTFVAYTAKMSFEMLEMQVGYSASFSIIQTRK